MSWFDSASFTNLAKTALTTAQKTIDKALDIQENSNSANKTSKKKRDADNFFEAFGLSDKSTTSQPAKYAKSKSDAQENVPLQGSSFWTDTWGSFFEMKAQNDASEPEPTVNKPKPKENDTKSGEAVMSQPHRANPFPAESHAGFDKTVDQSTYNTEENQEAVTSVKGQTEDVINTLDVIPENVIASQKPKDLDNVENSSIGQENLMFENQSVVTELHTLKVELHNINENVTFQVECKSIELHNDINENVMTDQYVDSNQSKSEVICDKPPLLEIEANESVICKQPQTISEVDLTFEQSSFQHLDQSDNCSLQVPLATQSIADSLSNSKPESEYDVIEINVEQASDHMDRSNSLTRSASVEAIQSISQSSLYGISSSTIEIPDIPASVADNIISWDCSTLDKLLPVSYAVEDESQVSNFSEGNQSINEELAEVASPDDSFHTITASSFSDNPNWVESKSSSQYVSESPNSSNGERNSHHSDGSSNSSKDDDDTDTTEVKECEVESSSSNGSQGTSSSSFVKCSIEEVDNGSHRGQSPSSTTASERSDITKHESEQNTSGDENETATSSDIEILSPPNGENGDRNASPLKHIWLPRPLKLRRSESPTSDSSKDSLMPVVSELEEVYDERDTDFSTMLVNESDRTRCHKRSDSNEDTCFEGLLQRQEEMQTILTAREKKILELSKENIELQENEQRLKNLMQKMREEQAKESRDITALTREFTQRLSQIESQLRQTTQEKETLHFELEEAKKEIAKRTSAAEIEEVMNDKDQQIKELTEEGQKLSKKELKHTTIIKALRGKEEEMTKTLTSLNGKLEENSKEVERLRKSISAKEEQEKKHIDAIRQLTNTVKKQEKEIDILKSNLEDSNEKEQTLKKSLDNTYMDLLVLRKSYEIKEKEIEDLTSGLEVEANENLRQKLENLSKEATKEKEALIMQMQDLRSSITRSEQEFNLREKMFKADITNLQHRLQEAEERNEDLTKNMSSASRPLVRQIENLQATYNSQISSWEKVEKNLTDRLSDVQNQLAICSEKERSATEKHLDLSSKVTAYESQNSLLRQEKLQLSSQLESLKANIIILEEKSSRETLTVDKVRQSLLSEINVLKQEKESVESTMAICLEQLEIEKKKLAKLEEEIKFKDARALVNQNVSPCPSPTGSFRSSIGSIHNWSQDEIQDRGTSTPINSYRMSVYDSLRLGSGSSLLENLQSQLKQREGEIIQLQSEISKLEKDKELMAQELVELSEQNENFQIKLDKLEAIEKDFKDLDQKYNTLLQMYGEKVEETEELHLDLADVKSMYKTQIEELLRSSKTF